MSSDVTHINTYPGPRGKLHDCNRQGECWCSPLVTVFPSRSHQHGTATVVDHRGRISPSVAAELARGGALHRSGESSRAINARKVS